MRIIEHNISQFTTFHLYRRMRYALTTLFAALVLAACANFQEIALSNDTIKQVNIPIPGGDLTEASDAWPQDHWWSAYGDPQLDRVIERGFLNSLNVAIAQSRIAGARA